MALEYKIRYDKGADSIYIKIREGQVYESDEVAPGVVVDYDKDGEIIGVEILWFSKRKVDLTKLLTEGVDSLIVSIK
ncbi:MAG: DUF2283 domain-containing protein [Pyrobaculum sp.]